MEKEKKRKFGSAVKLVGNIVTVLAIVFIILRLRKYGISWSGILTSKSIPILLVCFGIHTFFIVFNAVPWTMILDIFEPEAGLWRTHRLTAAFVYAKANVMKYIPGNIFQYVGRNELAVHLGLQHLNVVAATIIEVLLASLSVLFVALICIGSYTIEYFRASGAKIAMLACAAAIVIIIVVLLLYKWKRANLLSMITQCSRFIKERKARRRGIAFFFYYGLANICTGAVFAIVLNLCDTIVLTSSMFAIILGAYALSWLAGYITPGSPGGVGVREFILITVITKSGITNESAVIVASVIVRVISIFADLAALVILFLIYRCKIRRESDNQIDISQ